ncbi:MAG: helix-turn-helix domain-containing protein [Alphaproteobacteria bacterium]|jgi:cytoskeleton protein RodZ|nr:helix-turn-helix domain-containing protein [Candidatus Jidaibacter sp.]
MNKEILLSVGSHLKERRKEKGLSIDSISTALKIRKSYIAAIESGNTKILKFDAYTIGYIKHYCILMGLDPSGYIEAIKDSNSPKICKLGSDNLITGKEFLPSPFILYSSAIVLVALYIIIEFAA